MNRNSIVAVALAVVLGAGAWYYFGRSDSGAGQGPGGGRPVGAREVPVMTAQPKLKDFALEVEALGTVRAKESVDITAKIADRVTAIRFEEGKQVRKGDVLVELDNAEALADLAAAEAAERDSRSQFKRSQELFQTKALSEAQLDQLEATMLANQAKVAGSPLARQRSPHHRAVQRSRRSAQCELGWLGEPGRCDHDARRSEHREARLRRARSCFFPA